MLTQNEGSGGAGGAVKDLSQIVYRCHCVAPFGAHCELSVLPVQTSSIRSLGALMKTASLHGAIFLHIFILEIHLERGRIAPSILESSGLEPYRTVHP